MAGMRHTGLLSPVVAPHLSAVLLGVSLRALEDGLAAVASLLLSLRCRGRLLVGPVVIALALLKV